MADKKMAAKKDEKKAEKKAEKSYCEIKPMDEYPTGTKKYEYELPAGFSMRIAGKKLEGDCKLTKAEYAQVAYVLSRKGKPA